MPEDRPGVQDQDTLSFYYQQRLIALAKQGFAQLSALLKNAVIYPPAHPFLIGSAEQLIVTLEDLFSKRKEASYHLVSGEVFFETFSVPLEEALSQTVDDICRRGVGGITFLPGVSRDELTAFAFIMKQDVQAVMGGGGAAALMNKAGITRITVHRLASSEDRLKKSGVEKRPAEIFLDGIETVKEIAQTALVGKALNSRRLQGFIHSMVDSIMRNRDALIGLTSIKMYDEYTFAHSVNVSVLCVALGTFLSLEKRRVASLGIAGMLHDIGKVNIPLEIINKPEALTDLEWEIVKRHPSEGAVILSGLPGVGRLAMVAAFEHHMQHDLSGYPKMEGYEFNLHPFSRIVAIADAYDALTSARVYYDMPQPPHVAVKTLLSKRGALFDPVLVKTFVNMVGLFPIGTLLRLDTGETGLVIHQTRDLFRPRVLLLTKFDGTEKEEASLLEREAGRYKRSPVAVVDPSEIPVNLNLYLT